MMDLMYLSIKLTNRLVTKSTMITDALTRVTTESWLVTPWCGWEPLSRATPGVARGVSVAPPAPPRLLTSSRVATLWGYAACPARGPTSERPHLPELRGIFFKELQWSFQLQWGFFKELQRRFFKNKDTTFWQNIFLSNNTRLFTC